MKKKIIAIVLFVVVLVFPIVSWPIVKNYENTQINENRELAPAPQQFGNDYFEQVDNYFNDHAPYRNFLIKLHNDIERSFNKFYENFLNMFHIPYYTAVNDVLFGKDDWLFYLAEKSLDYYVASNLPTEQELAEMVEKAEKVNNYFKSQGKKFVIYTAPDKEQIYDNMIPSSITVQNEFKRPEVIANYFAEHSDVSVLYPRQQLQKERDNLQLYFKNDTHWNNAGAFYGCKALLEALGLEIGSATFTEKEVGGGDLSSMATLNNVSDLDYDISYRPDIEMTIKEGLEPTIENRKNDFHCESTNKNGKKLVMIGDSFRCSMINILGKDFEEATFTYVEHMYDDSFKEDLKDADYVVFESVERAESWLFLDGCLDSLIQMFNL